MKTSIISRTAIITGLLLGSFALAAIAATAWTAPTDAPPRNNVDAPINIGSNDQTKTANITAKGLIANEKFVMPVRSNPTSPATGEMWMIP